MTESSFLEKLLLIGQTVQIGMLSGYFGYGPKDLVYLPSKEWSLKSSRSESHCGVVVYFQTPEGLRKVMSEKESHSVAILWVKLWNNACMWSVPPGGHGRISPNSAFFVSLLLALYLTYSRCLVYVRWLHEQTHPEKYKAVTVEVCWRTDHILLVGCLCYGEMTGSAANGSF